MNTIKSTIIVLTLGTLVLSALLLGGCAKKLEGNAYENQKPIVWFANVPPESSAKSINQIVNWYGQDRDGQIDFYRYIVIREDVMGDTLDMPGEVLSEANVQTFVEDHLVNMSDTLWTKLLVRADSADPHTSVVVPMSAQIDNPVLVYVAQYVFIQAFDEEGLGSDIAFRRFLRNDNPPATRIVSFIAGVPFINSVFYSGSSTGIRMRWSGSDVIDYPTDPPPFEFEWKLFGPYSETDYAKILDSFEVQVFVTNDARVFKRGLPPQIVIDTVPDPDVVDTIPTMLIVCDTTYEDGEEVESCDTILIDTLESSNVYGSMDTLLEVYSEAFMTSPYYLIADSSHDEYGNNWTTETRDSIYNVYKDHPADTTQAGKFIFVVRSRDDAKVPDLTPAYKGFTVINPQHERDILVIDWSTPIGEHRPRDQKRTLRTYWDDVIKNWTTVTGHDTVEFDTTRDFKHIQHPSYEKTFFAEQSELVLRDILRYKVAVMTQDAAVKNSWSAMGDPVMSVMTGLQSGVNVWVCMRVPLGNYAIDAPPAQVNATAAYQYFFGVQQYTFPGWGSFLTRNGSSFGLPRTEDFVGTLSLDENQWPALAIDTALLRTKYRWEGYVPEPSCYTTPGCDVQGGFPFYPYQSDQFDFLGALPQVGWCVRTYDTEVMYLYKSLYGNEHAIDRSLSFNGRPVGIRLNRGLFKTVHFLFTPLSMKVDGAYRITNNVMNWLYDGRYIATTASKQSGQSAALAEDLNNKYWECYWQADGDMEKFYELLQNAY